VSRLQLMVLSGTGHRSEGDKKILTSRSPQYVSAPAMKPIIRELLPKGLPSVHGDNAHL